MNSRRIILMNLETADCEVFENITQIMNILKIKDNNFCSVEKLKKHPKFKEKYLFFSMESDILV